MELDKNSVKFLQDKPEWYRAGYETGYEQGYKLGKNSNIVITYIAGAAVLCCAILLAAIIINLFL